MLIKLIIFQEKDPFQEDLNQEITIGTVQVFLQPIAYMVSLKCFPRTVIIEKEYAIENKYTQIFRFLFMFKVEMKEQLEVTDLKGNKIGVMNVRKYKYI